MRTVRSSSHLSRGGGRAGTPQDQAPPQDQPEIPNSCGIWYIRNLKSWAQLVICGEHITVF